MNTTVQSQHSKTIKPKSNPFLRHAIISAAWVLALGLGTSAKARMFDLNSTTAGFGVEDEGSYDWWGAGLWNTLTDATADAGTAATTTWVSGNTHVFFVGAGANTTYTVRLGTDGSTSTMFRDMGINVVAAGNAALAGAAGDVTIGNTGDTGIMTIGQNNSIGAQNGGTLTINNGINMNAQTANFRGGNVVINGLVSGTGASRLAFNNGMGLTTGGTLTLANTANTFAGRLASDTITANFTLAVTKLADGGQNSSIGTSYENIGLGGGTLKFIGTGAQSTSLGINMNGGTIDASGATSADTITISGAPNDAGLNTTLTLAGTNTGANTIGFDFSNLGSGNKALKKQGVGTWVLSGTNSYTGATTISGGMLQFAKAASLYNSATASWTASNIRVYSGGTLALNVGGTDEFTTGNVTTLLTSLAVSGSVGNGMNAGSNLGFDTSNASGGTFTITNNIANTTGASGGTRGLTKLGTGTLALSGVNTYTGATTVNGGTLVIAGNSSGATGALTVESGAFLGGNGSYGGNITLNAGAAFNFELNADDSTLTCGGQLSFTDLDFADCIFTVAPGTSFPQTFTLIEADSLGTATIANAAGTVAGVSCDIYISDNTLMLRPSPLGTTISIR